jgi:hypothetical protein
MDQLSAILKKIDGFLAPVSSSVIPEGKSQHCNWPRPPQKNILQFSFCADSPSDWLDHILKEKLCKLNNPPTDSEVRWAYVKSCIDLLQELKDALGQLSGQADKESALPADTLSVSQQQHVSSMIQFIIALGVVPSLVPGVGLPLEKRSKFYECIVSGTKSEVSVDEVRKNSKRL